MKKHKDLSPLISRIFLRPSPPACPSSASGNDQLQRLLSARPEAAAIFSLFFVGRGTIRARTALKQGR